jgi:hypothetical protein
MSLTQDHGNHVFICDGSGCRSRLETNTTDFQFALIVSRVSGWKATHIGFTRDLKSLWAHLCPDCIRAGVQITHHESNVRQGELL